MSLSILEQFQAAGGSTVDAIVRYQTRVATILNACVQAVNQLVGNSMTVTLTATGQASGTAKVAGQVIDGAGNSVTKALVVRVSAYPSLASSIALAVTSGVRLSNAALAGSVLVIQTNQNGSFAFTVADSTANDLVYVECILGGGIPATTVIRGFQ